MKKSRLGQSKVDRYLKMSRGCFTACSEASNSRRFKCILYINTPLRSIGTPPVTCEHQWKVNGFPRRYARD